MKQNRFIVGMFLLFGLLFAYGCGDGSGSTDQSGPGAGSFNNDTFSVSPVTAPGAPAPQGLPVIADPITTQNKLVVKCEPNSTTTLGSSVSALCKLSSPQEQLSFVCLNGKVEGYLPAINCVRLTLNCNQSGFTQENCETSIP